MVGDRIQQNPSSPDAMPTKISPEAHAEATRIAKGTQRPGQTKEQTKAIIQGIEKGIAEYKKQEKAKARERDKLRKQTQRRNDAVTQEDTAVESEQASPERLHRWLPWGLLLASWLGFAGYVLWLGGR